MQTVIGINQETALKITNSKYYIPSGRSLQKREFIDDELIANSSVVADTLFQTKAGRTVIGGGGIGPDVIVKDEGSYPLAASILRSRGYFKFVQENNNQYSSIDEVLADEELMVKFKTFIEKNDISGYVDGQEDLKLAKEKLSKKEEKNLFINNAFSVIEKQIEKTQSTMFEDEKEIIQRMVHGEFAFYYNGYEGRYNIYLKDGMLDVWIKYKAFRKVKIGNNKKMMVFISDFDQEYSLAKALRCGYSDTILVFQLLEAAS